MVDNSAFFKITIKKRLNEEKKNTKIKRRYIRRFKNRNWFWKIIWKIV